jgi:outer membrane protein, heavy metal efflux system
MNYYKKENTKMKKLVISIMLTVIVFPVLAQNEIENVLREIESNNTTLYALREQSEARKLNNLTGIYLPNPEVEFNYLWGSPSRIGNRNDFNVTQSFDFPTAYGYRSKIARLENSNIELIYKSERITLLMRAKQICTDLVYYNALSKEYSGRLLNAERIAETWKIRFEKGDVGILEFNKAQLNLTTLSNEIHRIETERSSLLSELKALNGGKEILFTVSDITYEPLPPDFEEWYDSAELKSPVLQYLKGQIEVGQHQVKLNKALGLPRFSAGYMSENVGSEKFRGITMGVSVPLWENKNRVKQAEAQVKASEASLEDTKTQFYTRLQSLFVRSRSLQENTERYLNAISSFSNKDLLKKALDSGEISLLNYLVELEYYYESMDKLLETKRVLGHSLAELWAIEL